MATSHHTLLCYHVMWRGAGQACPGVGCFPCEEGSQVISLCRCRGALVSVSTLCNSPDAERRLRRHSTAVGSTANLSPPRKSLATMCKTPRLLGVVVGLCLLHRPRPTPLCSPEANLQPGGPQQPSTYLSRELEVAKTDKATPTHEPHPPHPHPPGWWWLGCGPAPSAAPPKSGAGHVECMC